MELADAELSGLCRAAGLDPADAEPVQRSVNHTYRFPSAGVVLRVCPDTPRVDRLVRTAAELERLEVPTVRLAPGFDQPIRSLGGPDRRAPAGIRLTSGFVQPIRPPVPPVPPVPVAPVAPVPGRAVPDAARRGRRVPVPGQPDRAADRPDRVVGWAATVWRLLPPAPAGRYPASDLAGPLRALHASRPAVDLPDWDPLGPVREMISRAATPAVPFGAWTREHLDRPGPAVLAALRARCDELAARLAAARWATPVGPVHADAHTGNLLRTASGEPVLADLDSISRGPAEVDLVAAAHAVGRLAGDPGDYRRLVDAYGFDVRESEVWSDLRALRDLQLAVHLLPRLPDGPVAAELARRLETVLTADDAAIWERYPAMT
ncbi:hypothetical protein [Actinoplanes sp. NPDC051851]|uniref:phosphotransferase n=1 Tax=Actinoplanes sp. NPDC051851 TaxID=3154753 RepID=UPI00343B7592